MNPSRNRPSARFAGPACAMLAGMAVAPAAAGTCFGPLAGQSGFPVCAVGPAVPGTAAAPVAAPAPDTPSMPMSAGAASPAGDRTDGTMGWTTPQGDGAYHVLPDGGTITSRRSGGPSTFHTYNDGSMGWTTPQGDGGAYHVLPDGRTVTSHGGGQGGGPTVFHNHGGGSVERPGRPTTALPPPGLFDRPPANPGTR